MRFRITVCYAVINANIVPKNAKESLNLMHLNTTNLFSLEILEQSEGFNILKTLYSNIQLFFDFLS